MGAEFLSLISLMCAAVSERKISFKHHVAGDDVREPVEAVIFLCVFQHMQFYK